MTMKPDADEGLGYIAQKIATGLVPDLRTEYAAADAGLITALLQAVAEEYDRGAAARVQDLAEMRQLFAAAAPHLADPELVERLKAEAEAEEASLRVRDLNASHDRCKALIIELHATVEAALDDRAAWAQALDVAIWRFYEALADRHAFTTALG